MMQSLLDTLTAATKPEILNSGSFRMTLLLIQSLTDHLPISPSYAAELVGKMDISIGNESFYEEESTFEAIAVEYGRILRDTHDLLREEVGDAAAHSYIKESAAKMSLRCS